MAVVLVPILDYVSDRPTPFILDRRMEFDAVFELRNLISHKANRQAPPEFIVHEFYESIPRMAVFPMNPLHSVSRSVL